MSEYANCTDGEIRLAGGTEMSGRVEICYNRVWYGVCSDNYNRYYVPATICKELNYSSQGTCTCSSMSNVNNNNPFHIRGQGI